MKLYIIGNGFDLHHGLPTAYRNYRDFLMDNHRETAQNYELLVYYYNDEIRKRVDNITDSEHKWDICWFDIESSLKINCFKSVIIPDEIDRRIKTFGASNVITNFTGLYFYEWLLSIKVNESKPDETLGLQPEDLYVTFNYLDMLETIYKIPKKQICHLHGYVKNLRGIKNKIAQYRKEFIAQQTKDYSAEDAKEMWKYDEGPWFINHQIHSAIQFGANTSMDALDRSLHFSEFDEDSFGDDEEASFLDSIDDGSDLTHEMEYFVNQSTKVPKNNYYKLEEFIDCRWSEIDTVIIMGHSLSIIDDDYYKMILVPNLKDRLWVFYAYRGDRSAINPFIKRHNLKHTCVVAW